MGALPAKRVPNAGAPPPLPPQLQPRRQLQPPPAGQLGCLLGECLAWCSRLRRPGLRAPTSRSADAAMLRHRCLAATACAWSTRPASSFTASARTASVRTARCVARTCVARLLSGPTHARSPSTLRPPRSARPPSLLQVCPTGTASGGAGCRFSNDCSWGDAKTDGTGYVFATNMNEDTLVVFDIMTGILVAMVRAHVFAFHLRAVPPHLWPPPAPSPLPLVPRGTRTHNASALAPCVCRQVPTCGYPYYIDTAEWRDEVYVHCW